MRVFHRGLVFLLSASPLALAMISGTRADSPLRAQPGADPELPVYYLDQGWKREVSTKFHYAPQGSELIPYYWFLNLAEADGTTLLKDDLNSVGALYDGTEGASANHDGLPIGFARQEQNGKLKGVEEKHWLGMTCAACHTGAVVALAGPDTPNPGTFIVDGAPSGLDFGAFLLKLQSAVLATYQDHDRLKAFAERVAASEGGVTEQTVERQFKEYTEGFVKKVLPLYLPPVAPGPGRFDCFGAIFNRVSVGDLQSQGPVPSPLNAPVDFPFIWYSDRQSQIQWFGEVPNNGWIFRLLRNAGEVSGVFAHVDPSHAAGLGGYPSSVNVSGLAELDKWVSALKPPKWTEVFSSPDLDSIGRGTKLFKDYCQLGGCHASPTTDGSIASVTPTPLHQDKNHNPLNLPDLNTDASNTTLTHLASAGTGILDGSPKYIVFGSPLPANVPAAELVGHVVGGALLNQFWTVIEEYVKFKVVQLFHLHDESEASILQKMVARAEALSTISYKSLGSYNLINRPTLMTAPQKLPATAGYESRSLNGIWATAPYLHNGSVPNLRQLLWLDDRKSTFYRGSRVYDPEAAGYVSDGSQGGTLFDTQQPGNCNQGHTYGSKLLPQQKEDIIAYLKTL